MNECCLNMHPILRLWLEHKSMPFAELLRVSERISEDCNSAECTDRIWTYTTNHAPTAIWKNRTSVRPVAPDYTTAHHALIDVPDIYFGNILAQYAKPNCAGSLWDSTSELSVCTHLHHRTRTLFKSSVQTTDLRTSSAAYAHFLSARAVQG